MGRGPQFTSVVRRLWSVVHFPAGKRNRGGGGGLEGGTVLHPSAQLCPVSEPSTAPTGGHGIPAIRLAHADPRDREPISIPFTLSEEALEARGEIARYYRVSETDALDFAAGLLGRMTGPAFRTFAKEEAMTVSGTLTLSRGALAALDAKAAEAGFSRDLVLEAGLTVYGARVGQAIQERLALHARALDILTRVGLEVAEGDEALGELLGDGDPVRDRFARLVTAFDALLMALEDELDGGALVEPPADEKRDAADSPAG